MLAKYDKLTEQQDRAMEMVKPLTPKSERQPMGRIAPVGLTIKGLCDKPKCLLKRGHEGECWPKP